MTREDLYKIVTPGHAFEKSPLVEMRRMIDAGTITDDCFVMPVEAIEEAICEVPGDEFVTQARAQCRSKADHVFVDGYLEHCTSLDRLHLGNWMLQEYLKAGQTDEPILGNKLQVRSFNAAMDKLTARRQECGV